MTSPILEAAEELVGAATSREARRWRAVAMILLAAMIGGGAVAVNVALDYRNLAAQLADRRDEVTALKADLQRERVRREAAEAALALSKKAGVVR